MTEGKIIYGGENRCLHGTQIFVRDDFIDTRKPRVISLPRSKQPVFLNLTFVSCEVKEATNGPGHAV